MVFVRKVFPELTNAGPASLPQRKVRKWNLQIRSRKCSDGMSPLHENFHCKTFKGLKTTKKIQSIAKLKFTFKFKTLLTAFFTALLYFSRCQLAYRLLLGKV